MMLKLLSIFDWITPLTGFVEDIVNEAGYDKSWTFFIPYNRSLDEGWNAFDIKRLMKKNGIKTWGGQMTGGEFFFDVKIEQAQFAEYILLRNRVPVNEKCLGAPRKKGK